MDIQVLEKALNDLLVEHKALKEKYETEVKAAGKASKETAEQLSAIQKQVDALDSTLATRHIGDGPQFKSFIDSFKDDENLQRLVRDKKGTVILNIPDASMLERKTVIDSTAVGAQTTGVLRIDRTGGIVQEARQQLTVRNALSARPTTFQILDFVKTVVPLSIASPQTESSAKAENQATFSSESEKVQTIATWIPASRQVLDDMSELLSYLQTGLAYYVDLAEEAQLLTGSGAGTDLNGLITQATAFNTGLLSGTAGWTRLDIIGRTIQQIVTAKELAPSFIVLNPVDFFSIRLLKDTQGRYLFPPNQAVDLFGLTPIVTTSIAVGTFLVGSGSPIAAEIRDRMGMQVEISTQHDQYFVKNLVAIRAEKRLALVTYRPASFITGTFTSSPA